jgi:hypothetical protein
MSMPEQANNVPEVRAQDLGKKVGLAHAEAEMNKDNGYATIDIPSGFTNSLLALTVPPTPSGK